MAARLIAGCLAAALCCALIAPSFVQPSGVRTPSLRASQGAADTSNGRARDARGFGVAPMAALMVAGAAVAAAARSRIVKPAAAKVARAAGAFDPTKELGIQAPARFWDPLGLSADGDEATFKRRRAVEIKHGRISMLATIGYIVPEYARWPGYLSPSEGLKFTDVPNGLAALSKVPLLGWVQIVIFIGMAETSGLKNGNTTNIAFMKDASMAGEPGNYGLGFLGNGLFGSIEDKTLRDRKLNAELANGRLAMIAILAMLFQNGVTGTTESEMWGGIVFELPGLRILLPALAVFAIGGETFRRGPDDKFKKYVDRPDVYKYRGRV